MIVVVIDNGISCMWPLFKVATIKDLMFNQVDMMFWFVCMYSGLCHNTGYTNCFSIWLIGNNIVKSIIIWFTILLSIVLLQTWCYCQHIAKEGSFYWSTKANCSRSTCKKGPWWPTSKYDYWYNIMTHFAKSYQFLDLRLAVLGNMDAGKSTLLGVLTQGELDNGRGKARLNLFRHLHEIQSGRTSSISHGILGFNSDGKVIGI